MYKLHHCQFVQGVLPSVKICAKLVINKGCMLTGICLKSSYKGKGGMAYGYVDSIYNRSWISHGSDLLSASSY